MSCQANKLAFNKVGPEGNRVETHVQISDATTCLKEGVTDVLSKKTLVCDQELTWQCWGKNS